MVHVTGLSQAWWYERSVDYATKRPLGTIHKNRIVSQFRVCVCRRYTWTLYVTKGDVKHNQLNPSGAKKKQIKMMDPDLYHNMLPYLAGGGRGEYVLYPQIYPLREPGPDSPIKKHPLPHLYCTHMRVQSFDWAGNSSRE